MRRSARAPTVAKVCGLITFLLALSSHWFVAIACTTFVIQEEGELLFGRNLDWHTGTGLIIANPRNLSKEALIDAAENPAKWTSKYGSITFNQVGRELPYGGINEVGLVVEHMSLDETQYPARDDRSGISACQWIQFQLDNYSTVEEVLKSDALLRIVDSISHVHFLVCDRSGQVAAIEFLEGKMVSHTGRNLPVKALANSTYDYSFDCRENGQAIETDRSLYNFVTAARMVDECPQEGADSSLDYAFKTLQSVSQGPVTKWSIVYDVKRLQFHVKVFETPTLVGEQKIFLKAPGSAVTKVVDVTEFNFDELKRARVLDLESEKAGNVNDSFTVYTTSLNRQSIAKAFQFIHTIGFLSDVSDEDLEALASYPESFGHSVRR